MDADIKIELKRADSRDRAERIIAGLDARQLSESDLYFLDRTLDRLPCSFDVKLAFLASFNLDPLPVYARVLSEVAGLRTAVYVGEYNQYFQETLDSGSKLHDFLPDVIFLALALRQLAPELLTSFTGLAIDERKRHLETVIAHVSDWVEAALRNTRATVVLANFPLPPSTVRVISDLNSPYGQTELFMDLNLALLRRFKGEARVHVFDLDQLAAEFGRNRAHDSKLYYLAKREWSEQFVRYVAAHLVRFIKSAKNLTRKCLVLDLDNTLWGGIVGEDGATGLRVGMGDPEGEAFLDFQHKIRNLKDRGVLLAICSKNNPDDVTEAFAQRPEMPLTLADFAAIQVNWDNKVDNLKRIATSLNIGLDSLVFLDDSPFECNLVREMLPEVRTIQVPDDPARLPFLIDEITDFDRLVVTKEDAEKGLQYQQQRQREMDKQGATDLGAYLRSLQTEVVIRPPIAQDVQRVHQLFTKTNQFNLTTIRYSVGQIDEFISNGAYELRVVEARDKFGDLGKIGLYLVRIQGEERSLQGFILSCRAMGRGIETAMMNYLKLRAKSTNSRIIEARYVPTKKNSPIASLCEEQGFRLVDASPGGEKRYMLLVAEAKTIACDWISVKTPGDK